MKIDDKAPGYSAKLCRLLLVIDFCQAVKQFFAIKDFNDAPGKVGDYKPISISYHTY